MNTNAAVREARLRRLARKEDTSFHKARSSFVEWPGPVTKPWPGHTTVRRAEAEHKMIGLVWCVDDVIDIRPDLTPEQAWVVLLKVNRHEDASVGISWDQIEFWAEKLFPEG